MEIVYQDKRIVVAVKPVGILSTDEPCGMPELLRQELKADCIRSVHRLDAQVSGLMVYARSAKAASLLSQQVREHRLEKEYLAVVQGELSEKSGTLRDLLGRDKNRRITYVAGAMGPDVQEAVLDYTVLSVQCSCSLVRIRLHTGRTHQIRVQFSSRGFPLLGDRKYGGSTAAYPIALWSYRLGFLHPQTLQPLTFQKLPPRTEPWSFFSPKCFPEGISFAPVEK